MHKNKYITKMLYGGNNWGFNPLLPPQNNLIGVDYALQFARNTLPQLNRMKMQVGFATHNSTNPAIAFNGKRMLNEVTQFPSFLYETPNVQDISHLTGGANWDLAINIASGTLSSLPGKFGQIGNTGSTIYRSVLNLKDIKDATEAAGSAIKGAKTAKAGNIAAIAGAASDLIGGFLPEKDEYQGPKGDITQTMDTVYDGISDAAMALGPVGMLVGGIMKGGSMLGKGMNALGGGTDGMTTTDAILGSSFLSLTPFGLINGFGGERADTITKDNQAFETIGASYTGSNLTIDDALQKSGKKYGLFSRKAMNRANKEIDEAKRQQTIITDIADDSADRFAIRNSMAAINGNRRLYNMLGGYNQGAVRVGKQGLIVSPIKAKRIVSEHKKNERPVDPFKVYLLSLPEEQRDSTNFRVRDYWEFNGKPKDFNEAKSREMFTLSKDGKYHARSIAENPSTGEIEYMKSENHPTRYMESDWYEKGLIYNDDGSTTKLSPGMEGYDDWVDFTNTYELLKTSPYWKYVKRNVISRLNGGTLEHIPTEIILVEEDILEFLKGGSINIIPDGALHARKHNMNIDGITPKGIPVVTEKEGGELEQLAEIEKEEIIFRLEVTKKLEELMEEFYDEDSSLNEKDKIALEAGKLLVEEILHNTIDNTKSLL